MKKRLLLPVKLPSWLAMSEGGTICLPPSHNGWLMGQIDLSN